MTAKRLILCPPYGKVPIEKAKYNKPPLCFNVLNKFDTRWAPDNRHLCYAEKDIEMQLQRHCLALFK